MATVNIIIDLVGEPSGVPGQARTFAYTKISSSACRVSLSLQPIVGATSYFWELLDKPLGSTAVLSTPTASTTYFDATATFEGTYLIQCTVNGTSHGTNAIAFLTPTKGLRKFAAGESLEFGSTGWTASLNSAIDAIETGGVPVHGDYSPGDIHVLHNWEYADATARLAATGFSSDDIYKLAVQLDNNTVWMLIDDSPVTWGSIGGGGSSLTDWTDAVDYVENQEVLYLNLRFRANTDHTSSASFFTDLEYWDCMSNEGIIVNQVSHGFAALDVIYDSSGTWAKAKADSISTLSNPPTVVMGVSTNYFLAAFDGRVTITSHGLTANTTYYLSSATAGLLTSTKPTTSTHFLNPILRVKDSNTVSLYPDIPDWVGLSTAAYTGTNGPDGSVPLTGSGAVDFDFPCNSLIDAINKAYLGGGLVYWSGTTTNDTPAEIFVGGVPSTRYTLTTSSTVVFFLTCVARDNTTNRSKVWEIKGVAQCSSADASDWVDLTPTYTVVDQSDSSGGTDDWDVALSIDDSDESVRVTVTGQTSTTIQWVVYNR